MSRRNQKMDDKHQYESPTTPGLWVTFRAYLIELVCINTARYSLGPRFWQDKKYWGPKFARETRGVKNLLERYEDSSGSITAPMRLCVINAIKNRYVKSLSSTKTLGRLHKWISQESDLLVKQRTELEKRVQEDVVCDDKYMEQNSAIVKPQASTKATRLREMERNG